MEAAELRFGFAEHRNDIGLDRNITSQSNGMAARGAHLAGRLLSSGPVAHVVEREAPTLARA
jgi:hypothetical protein